MDTETLIAQSRARFDHQTAKRLLKEKYQAKMLFAHAGGMWRAGPELQAVLLQCSPTDPVVILDLYENPIKLTAPELFAKSHSIWQEQMNAWLVEFEQQQKTR
jgi:hypothetical protein